MLISNKFIYIHLPKTGGTFVASALNELFSYKGPGKNLLFRLRYGGLEKLEKLEHDELLNMVPNNHLTCSHIPTRYIDGSRIMFSTIRDPLKRYKSLYEFGWWIEYPHCGHEIAKAAFPHFPELSFSEFMDLMNIHEAKALAGMGEDYNGSLGFLSVQFIKFFSKTPDEVLKNVESIKTFNAENLNLYPIEFLHTENLNSELSQLLGKLEYPRSFTEGLLEKKVVRPRDVESAKRIKSDYHISDSDISRIKRDERLLYDLFPNYS